MEENKTNKKAEESKENPPKETIETKEPEVKVETKTAKEKKSSKSTSTKKTTKKKPENKKDKQISELQEKVDSLNDKHLRLNAEFDNYRKRTLKEKMELSKSAGKQIFENMLPVIDDLERAMQSIESAEDVEAVKEGMNLIHSKFISFLNQQGVQSLDAVGKEFNTDEHEAITKIPAPTEELKGKVVDVVTKGYKLNDQILRYSKVVVGE